MKNLKIKTLLTSPTTKLAATYLVIIMVMSIGFSTVMYNTSTRQFDRPIPPNRTSAEEPGHREPFNEDVVEIIKNRFNETKTALRWRLIFVNLGSLAAGAYISYLLARRTLQPIEEAMEAQSQFISDASHELRTPLTVLQTTNEVALRNKKLSVATARKLIEHNIDEAKKLNNLSESLLNLLKDSQPLSQVSTVDIQDVVTDSINQVLQLALEKGISIDDQTPSIAFDSDRMALTRALTILLENAIKYSDKDKNITVNATQEKNKILLSVSDNGIGIKASDLPYIFRRFYRADKSRTSQDINGYGLGLSIAEKLVHQLGGNISVTSKPGSGSEFTIELPFAG